MDKKLLLTSIAVSLLGLVVLLPIARGDVNSAVAYLKTKPVNPWISMTLVANGESPNVDYLKTVSGSNATDYEAPILALVAAGKDPKTFPDTDLVAALKTFHTGGQIGSASTLNDDIFGVLALLAAGEPLTDSAVQDAKNFILSNQNTNGGWSFAVGGDSDTNMTSMAIMALLEAGILKTDSHIVNAVNYLKAAQNDDGGFPYDPVSPWGTGSDASSDAWVISAINKLGEDPNSASWSKNGNSPVSHLLSLQANSGYFAYQAGFNEDSFSPITTAYAAVALMGKYYPVSGVAINSGAPNVDYRIEGSAGLICEGEVNTQNALDLVKAVASVCGFTYEIVDTSFGPYLKRIGSDEAHDLVGWLYAVNFVLGNVGAADYHLENGDYVLWHFGEFNWQPSGTEVNLSANVLSGSSNGGNETSGGGTISFAVNVSGGGNNANFGDITPGMSKSQTVTVTNNSSSGIYVESVVNGDEVFKNFISIQGVSWREFSLNLGANISNDAQVTLQVPSSYSNSGSKAGKLIFWATSN